MTEILTNITLDLFLGGRLRIFQPNSGYRAGIDPVLLAASLPAKAGERVLELGCGVGVASLCLMCRVAGVEVSGVEFNPKLADLARCNGRENGLSLNIFDGDIVIIEQSQLAENDEKVVVRINHREVTLKTLRLDQDGVKLVPANYSMEPIIRNNANVEVLGIVRGVIRDRI